MATKAFRLQISIYCVSAGSDDLDRVAEFYGSISYRHEGQSSWTTIAQASDSSPWYIRERDATEVFEILPYNFKIDIPDSATFIEIQSSLKEYDPTIFDADENLGTQTISVPVPTPGNLESKEGSQGNGSIGQANISVRLVSVEDYENSLNSNTWKMF